MSYRQCIFAFPYRSVDQAGVLELARRAAHELSGDLDDFPAVHARVNDAAWAERAGAWLLMLCTTRDSDRVLGRGFFEDFWEVPFSVIIHDDSNGKYLFQHHHPVDGFSVGSDCGELHGDLDRVKIVADQNAVVLGILQVYGRALHYLDLLDTPTAWRLYDPDAHVGAPEEVEAPRSLRNYVDAWPGDELTRTTTRPPAPAPDDLTARYNRACAHARRGDRAAMLEDLAACIAAQPEDADDADGDDDFAAYHGDPDFQALIAHGRASLGRPVLPAGLVAMVIEGEHEAFAFQAVLPRGVLMFRISYYPHERARLAEVLTVPPPAEITPAEIDAYAARLTAHVARFPDLMMSVLAVATTERGVIGWRCGPAAVWRADVDGNVRISPSPYLEAPPGTSLPPDLPPDLIICGISKRGAEYGAWFEADGEAFALVLAHPLPDFSMDPLRDIDDVEGHVRAGVVGFWRRR